MNPLQNTLADNTDISDLEKRLHFSSQLRSLSNKIHATNNVDEIMLDLSRDICDLFHCDRLTLYAVSKDKEFIFSRIKTGLETKKDLVLPLTTQSIAGYVALFKRCIRLSDVYDEAELKNCASELTFLHTVDRITGYRTRQMLAAPIVEANTKELLGVIQLINNREDGAFTAAAEQGLMELCETMAVAFMQRMKAPAAAQSKYEPLVLEAVISAPELELATRSARRKNLDIEDVLIDEFQVQPAAIGQALARTYGLPYESYNKDRIRPADLVKKLKREMVEKNQWLPIAEEKIGLIILTTDPERISNAHDIRQIFPYASLFYRVTTKREFRQTIDQFFGGK